MDFTNPITFPSISGLLIAVLNVAIVIAVPIVVMFVIYAGFLYVTARGNPAKIQEAARALTYSIIGGVIIIGAVAITAIVEGTVNSFTP